VSGNSVTDWAASSGSAEFATNATSDACSAFPVPSGFSCVKAALVAAFTIAHTSPIPEDDHSAALASVAVPGVLLTINNP
jgi:hypothetical protein